MDDTEIKYFVEAALLAAGRPLSADQLQKLFDGRSTPDKAVIRQAIADLTEEYQPRGLTIQEVASGYRIQIESTMADRLHKLWEGRPPRYSRALFETLALIAYRQPITRGEIEDIRGVTVSSNIVRTLLERDWVRVVGHRDVPGRPAMFGTTRAFLDYFGLKKLDDLPELADLADWESLRVQLDLPDVDAEEPAEASPAAAVSVLVTDTGESEDTAGGDSATAGSEPVFAEADDVNEGTSDNVSDDVSDNTSDDLAEAFEEELVVSAWPDPADSKEVAVFDTGDSGDADDDKDASASG